MNIAIIGAGAMGGLFAGRLAESGQSVSLIEVSPQLIDAISSEGVRLEGHLGASTSHLPIGPAERYQSSFDLLIVFTKGLHTAAAMAAALPLIGPSTWALTVQNGIGNVEAIEPFIPRSRIAMGMTNWPSTPLEPGRILVPGEGQVRLWSADGATSTQLTKIADALDGAGLNCALDEHVEIAIWEKLAFNAALNSIAAITGLSVGEIADLAATRELAFAVVRETVAVAQARRIGVDEAHIRAAVEHAFAEHRTHKPSMLQDRLAGRSMEIITITGAVAAASESAGVETPVTTTLTALLLALDDKRAGALPAQ